MKTLLIATALTASLTAGAQARAVSCPGGHYVQRLDGQLLIVCPTILTPEQYQQALENERQRAADWERNYGDGRPASPPPSSFSPPLLRHN